MPGSRDESRRREAGEPGADHHNVGLVTLLLLVVLGLGLLVLGGLGGRGPCRRGAGDERPRHESPPCDPVLLVHPETALFAWLISSSAEARSKSPWSEPRPSATSAATAHPSRAASARARPSDRPRRKPAENASPQPVVSTTSTSNARTRDTFSRSTTSAP